MRVLLCPSHYVYESSIRGSEYRHAFEVADHIATCYPGSVVITGKITQPGNRPYKIVEVQKRTAAYEMTLIQSLLFSMRYTIVGARELIRQKYDVIHHVRPFNLGFTFNLLPLIFQNRHKAFIIGSFSSPYEETSSKGLVRAIKPMLNWLSTLTLSAADKIVVYDQLTLNMVAKYTSEKKIVIIAPGVDGEQFFPAAKTNTINKHIIAVGYLIPRKRMDYLIRVFSHVHARYPDAKLTIVGDGVEQNNLELLIAELGLSEAVNLTGFIPNHKLSDEYRKAGLFAMFQEAESYGQVYLEALASGLPVVTSDNIGSRLLINDSIGRVVSDHDTENAAQVIIKLFDDPSTYHALSANARREFEAKYSTKAVKQRWSELYEDIIKDKRLGEQ